MTRASAKPQDVSLAEGYKSQDQRRAKVRDYEVMLITPTSLDKEHEDEVFKKAEETIEKNGGKIEKTSPMGKRKLAYPIADQTEAIYTVVYFSGNNKTISELNRVLKITGEVIRHGIFKVVKPKKSKFEKLEKK
ncbi:MAG: 30S ribosomal protein S6 [Actinobacteria bacterium]|nr:MAG: 30S ribosomal protein S6 [Actinomycetota bacterium]